MEHVRPAVPYQLELLEEGHLEGCSMWKDGQYVHIGWTELMPDGAELISPLPKREEASIT